MKILLQRQHSIKINVSDGKYECHLYHLPPNYDESRDLIKLTVLSTVWFQTYWRLLRVSIIHACPVFNHFWPFLETKYWSGQTVGLPEKSCSYQSFSRSFLQCCSSLFFTSLGAWCSLETLHRGEKILIWGGSGEPPLCIIHHTFSLAGAEHF